LFSLYSIDIFLGYEEIVTIPAGARNIFIEELGPSKNYIGIGSESSEEFYLNGKLCVYAMDPILTIRQRFRENVYPSPTTSLKQKWWRGLFYEYYRVLFHCEIIHSQVFNLGGRIQMRNVMSTTIYMHVSI